MSETKFLRKKQVADRLGVTVQTISRWIKLGVFPKPIRTGPTLRHNVLFPESAVNAWVAEREAANAIFDTLSDADRLRELALACIMRHGSATAAGDEFGQKVLADPGLLREAIGAEVFDGKLRDFIAEVAAETQGTGL